VPIGEDESFNCKSVSIDVQILLPHSTIHCFDTSSLVVLRNNTLGDAKQQLRDLAKADLTDCARAVTFVADADELGTWSFPPEINPDEPDEVPWSEVWGEIYERMIEQDGLEVLAWQYTPGDAGMALEFIWTGTCSWTSFSRTSALITRSNTTLRALVDALLPLMQPEISSEPWSGAEVRFATPCLSVCGLEDEVRSCCPGEIDAVHATATMPGEVAPHVRVSFPSEAVAFEPVPREPAMPLENFTRRQADRLGPFAPLGIRAELLDVGHEHLAVRHGRFVLHEAPIDVSMKLVFPAHLDIPVVSSDPDVSGGSPYSVSLPPNATAQTVAAKLEDVVRRYISSPVVVVPRGARDGPVSALSLFRLSTEGSDAGERLVVKVEKRDDADKLPLDACALCFDDITEATNPWLSTTCAHVFHKDCIAKWIDVKKNSGEVPCPTCKTALGRS